MISMNAGDKPGNAPAVRQVRELFRNARFPWWIAGGWGIDLWLGRHTRAHEDIDVLILRPDQMQLREVLAGWDLHAADPPGTGSLRPWLPDEELRPPVHEVWCRRNRDAPWQVEVMLGETEASDWVFRRNPTIRRSIHSLGHVRADGIPRVVPEVLLLFKAKNPRPKDERDFECVLPTLSQEARKWLRDALTTTHPEHPWLARLGSS